VTHGSRLGVWSWRRVPRNSFVESLDGSPSMTDCTRWRTSAGASWTPRVAANTGEAWTVACVFRRQACHIAVKDGSRPVR
jgi:hypothetical protein